ncbi:protease complex subunit PrcB family protein [Candidatus Kaiserbacteria bacterium]|nr:protease complex subunit PrcB family protein [Candidatus Kaiserbacteria bacterium]
MKDALVVVALALVAIAVGAVLYTKNPAAPSAPATIAGTPVSFSTLASGIESSVKEPKNYLITSEPGLQELWQMINSQDPPPIIDFTKNSVIAIFAGAEPTAGYEIKVSAIADSASRQVLIVLTKPGGSCIVPQIVTAPYEVVELPATALPLTHQQAVETTSCLQ